MKVGRLWDPFSIRSVDILPGSIELGQDLAPRSDAGLRHVNMDVHDERSIRLGPSGRRSRRRSREPRASHETRGRGSQQKL